MNKGNVRYGVVNFVRREKFEKEFHLPYGYGFVTWNKEEAIKVCRDYKDDHCVEMIYDTATGKNLIEEIYRSGNEKDS